MPVSQLLKDVADYCWSNKFLDVFRQFFKDHAEDFEGAPAMCSGEHNLKYYSLFQTYLKLYEDVLEEYLNTIGVPIGDFYQDVREAQHETHDMYISTFIDCLLASADYDSFYKVMSKEGQRIAVMKEASGLRPAARADDKANADDKADSKAGGGSGAKASAAADTDDDGKAVSDFADEKKSSHK